MSFYRYGTFRVLNRSEKAHHIRTMANARRLRESIERDWPEVLDEWERYGHSRANAARIAAEHGWKPGQTYAALSGHRYSW